MTHNFWKNFRKDSRATVPVRTPFPPLNGPLRKPLLSRRNRFREGSSTCLDPLSPYPPGADMTEAADRNEKSVTVDGESISYLSPAEQTREDSRQATSRAVQRKTSLPKFLRMFGMRTADRP